MEPCVFCLMDHHPLDGCPGPVPSDLCGLCGSDDCDCAENFEREKAEHHGIEAALRFFAESDEIPENKKWLKQVRKENKEEAA